MARVWGLSVVAVPQTLTFVYSSAPYGLWKLLSYSSLYQDTDSITSHRYRAGTTVFALYLLEPDITALATVMVLGYY